MVSQHPVARLMGGGFYARMGALGLIVIDPDLSGVERRAVLTHELIHHERGGGAERVGATPTQAGLATREEQTVEREVARRLVPPDQLRAYLHEATRGGGGVGAAEVASQFEVPLVVATAALRAFDLGGTPRPGRHG